MRCIFREHNWKQLGDVRVCQRCTRTEIRGVVRIGEWIRARGTLRVHALKRWWRQLDRERGRSERATANLEKTIARLRERINVVA